jgi:hypothetical protein
VIHSGPLRGTPCLPDSRRETPRRRDRPPGPRLRRTVRRSPTRPHTPPDAHRSSHDSKSSGMDQYPGENTTRGTRSSSPADRFERIPVIAVNSWALRTSAGTRGRWPAQPQQAVVSVTARAPRVRLCSLLPVCRHLPASPLACRASGHRRCNRSRTANGGHSSAGTVDLPPAPIAP